MAKIKGCINEMCSAKHKKILYKEDDQYCPKCGQALYYVCKSCHTKLPDGNEKYCVRCLAKREDCKNDIVKGASAVVAGVGTAAKAAPKLIKDSEVLANAGKDAIKMGKTAVSAIKNIKK